MNAKLLKAIKLGFVTAVLFALLPFLASIFIVSLPALSNLFGALALGLFVSAFILAFLAFYISSWVLRGTGHAAIKYGAVLGILEFLASFDIIAALIAMVGGVIAYEAQKMLKL